jgi:hypothetical protein
MARAAVHPLFRPLPDLPFSLETPIELQLAADPEWRAGLSWGVPRPGHPEGQIVRHIREVLDNVDGYYARSSERGRLRLIALVHDTFKYSVDRSAPGALRGRPRSAGGDRAAR